MYGIDSINLYVPPVAASTDTIQNGRGLTMKQLRDIGFVSRSLVPCFEDTVTMAVNAAHQLITPESAKAYGLLIVGTESGFDYGKPISTYIHKYLGLAKDCRNFEIKHACYSGTSAMLTALSWLKEPQNKGRKALVVMSDFSRNHLGDPSEITTGSGAIALSLSENPSILAIDSITGIACHEVFDVARPTKDFEWGDSVLSLYSYLDLVELAWHDFSQKQKIDRPEDVFKAMLYHMPLLSLIEKAHQLVYEYSHDDASDKEISSSFDQLVRPALIYNLQTSNIYSGSLYVSILGFLCETQVSPGDAIALYSYGSGACSEFFKGIVQENAQKNCLQHHIADRLNKRYLVDFETYEHLIKKQQEVYMLKDYKAEYDQVPDLFDLHYKNKDLLILEQIENYHRKYIWS